MPLLASADYQREFAAMGCPCVVAIEGLDARRASIVANIAQREVDRLDRKYSHYRDDSELARWHAAWPNAVLIDDESQALLQLAAVLHADSGGRFDITAAPLTRLWDGKCGRMPTPEEIEAARRHVGFTRLIIDGARLSLPSAEARIEFGGLVKEYAADRAAELCRQAGAHHGIVDLGGDIAVIGPHADGAPWRIGIRNPNAPAAAIADIELASGGLATSGDYERCLVVDGKRYSHIVDPTSGWPVAGFSSVSVSAPSTLIAGAACTTAMLLGLKAGSAYLNELALPWVAVGVDGEVSRTAWGDRISSRTK